MSGKNDTKHTPGPWTAGRNSESSRYEIIGGSIDDTDKKTVVGTFFGGFGYTKQNDPNARLIAAAPELLEALSKLVLHVGHYSSMPHAHPDAARDMANARAAIAKAEGAQPE